MIKDFLISFKDFLISFKDNISTKSRNPFFGTYVFVWIVRNWEVVFTFFNFDKGQKLAQKIELINKHFENKSFWCDTTTNVLYSIGILIASYILLNLSRYIVNIFEKRVTPCIYKVTDSKTVILKSKYDTLKNERNFLLDELTKLRDQQSKLEGNISDLQNERFQRSQTLVPNKPENNTELLIKKLEERHMVTQFRKIGTAIKNKQNFDKDERILQELLNLDLINSKPRVAEPERPIYILTDEGANILKLLRFRYDK